MENEISGGTPAVENWSDGIEVHESSPEPVEKVEAPEEPKVEKPPETEEQRTKKKQTGYIKKLGRAEAERDMERSQRVALEKRIAELEGKSSAAPEAKQELAPNDGRPNPNDPKYENNFLQYNEDLIDWKADQKATSKVESVFKERDQVAETQKFEADIVKRAQDYSGKLEEYEGFNPGTKAQLAAVEELASEAVVIKILQSDSPLDMALYLKDQPETVSALSQMNPDQLKYAMARIEGMVEGKKSYSSGSSQERTTKASDPIPTVKKTGSATKSPENMTLRELDKIWKK